MAFLRIHCDYCGGTWEIYHRDNWKDDKARQCPHCFSEIDPQTWNRQILPAFGSVHDANAELFKDHVGQHRPIFSFDVIADHYYQDSKPGNREFTCPLFDDLADSDYL